MGGMKMPVKEFSEYEPLLYRALARWWKISLNASTREDLCKKIVENTLISKTDARKFCLEEDITKRFIYWSVMYGFDMATETNCYIVLYD